MDIYHYTTQDGFLGICSSRGLWASKIHYLNDVNEFSHAFTLMKSVITSKSKNFRNGDLLNRLVAMFNRVEKLNIFVISFSEEQNLLSQWRAYSTGSGLNIGFSVEQLKALAKQQGFSLERCLYNNEDKSRVILEEINELDNLLEEVDKSNDQAVEDILIKSLFRICRIAPIFKDEYFSEEKEWRLISPVMNSNSEKVGFRTGNSNIIPYVMFSLEDHEGRVSISSAIAGPSKNIELQRDAMMMVLSRYNIDWQNCPFERIPYRNW